MKQTADKLLGLGQGLLTSSNDRSMVAYEFIIKEGQQIFTKDDFRKLANSTL